MIMVAIQEEDITTVELLLTNNIYLELVNSNSATALMQLAVGVKNIPIPIVKKFLQRGANHKQKNRQN